MDRRDFIKQAGTASASVALLGGSAAADQVQRPAAPEPRRENPQPPSVNYPVWFESTLRRVYPNSTPLAKSTGAIYAARGERLSFQACLRNNTTGERTVSANVKTSGGLTATIRRVGLVPMRHLNTVTPWEDISAPLHVPGFVPDPLFPENEALIGPYENAVFWITVDVPESTEPGTHPIEVELTPGEHASKVVVCEFFVSELVIEPRKDFPVTHWFYADAICDWYKVNPWEEGFWELAEPYMQNLVSHGNNVQYVPLFTPPTDGVKRPTQLLRVKQTATDQYEFNFQDVKRWVNLARRNGAEKFEWSHLFTQWGVHHAIRVYADNADEDSLFWPPETGATDEKYRKFLSQFLPEFHRFLQSESLLEDSYFHISDEPSGDEAFTNYRAARSMIAELAPWMRVMDAMSHVDRAREMDMPVAIVNQHKAFVEKGIPSWAYYCCGPRGAYVNRLLDTLLTKIRMTFWIMYKFQAKGFLHWGYNYWYTHKSREMINPFETLDGNRWPNIAYGDTFVVYPGEKGPIDSLRWEVFRESLQDYALLQTAGIEIHDKLLKDIMDYNEFPKDENWIMEARRKILVG